MLRTSLNDTNVIDSQSGLTQTDESYSDQLELQLFTQENALHSLHENWENLAKRCSAHMCSSPEWIRAWWTNFGKHDQRSLYVITLWRDSELVALAPMYKGYSTLGGVLVQERLQMIGSGGSPNEQIGFTDDYGISDFLDILVDPDDRQETARVLSEFFNRNVPDVDIITFHQARDDSFVLNNLAPLLSSKHAPVEVTATDICPYIVINGLQDLKGFIKQQKSNARRRLRQTVKGREKKEVYSLRNIQTERETEQAVEQIIQLHQERWNRLGFPGVFHDSRFIGFFRQIMCDAKTNGWLWFKEAVDEQGVCASRMLVRYNNRYYDYISGFDEQRDSSKYRPGIGLLLNLVNDAIKEGIDTVELLRGEESYKYDFTEKALTNWKITFKPGKKANGLKRGAVKALYGQALLYKHWSRESRLLDVQRESQGVTRALPGYLRFRYNSLKIKFGL